MKQWKPKNKHYQYLNIFLSILRGNLGAEDRLWIWYSELCSLSSPPVVPCNFSLCFKWFFIFIFCFANFLGFCPVLLISIATVDEHCFRQVLMYLCFVWWRLMILIPVINNKQRTILQLVYLLIYDILLIILTGIIMIFFFVDSPFDFSFC